MTDRLRHQVSRLADRISRRLKAALGIALLVMVGVNVANALGRYSGLFGLTGADELLVFMMIWVVMLGAILALRERDHLTLEFAPRLFGPRGRGLALALADLATALISAFVAWQGWLYAARIAEIGQVSMGLGAPMAMVHFAIPLGFGAMALIAAVFTLDGVLGRGGER